PHGSLADALAGRGPQRLLLPVGVTFAVDLVLQIAAALQYIHRSGRAHRDLKPSKVLLQMQADGRWQLLLAGFGIARAVEGAAWLPQADQMLQMTAYKAPEQLSEFYSPVSDQYALGVLAYVLLAGRVPFEGGIVEQMWRQPQVSPP